MLPPKERTEPKLDQVKGAAEAARALRCRIRCWPVPHLEEAGSETDTRLWASKLSRFAGLAGDLACSGGEGGQRRGGRTGWSSTFVTDSETMRWYSNVHSLGVGCLAQSWHRQRHGRERF
ncbi:hypothetical protein GCM10023205_83770 [Yinghuangia aomiensis]|uniref:Uncharacterized protein n=1 Tax=Yinghuangia aomiensis TaxID=676205 RepID=A0ABP9IGU9_9ACTN